MSRKYLTNQFNLLDKTPKYDLYYCLTSYADVLLLFLTKDAAVQPSLVITYFGGNDSMNLIPSKFSPHVPLPEFIENMRKIATHLKVKPFNPGCCLNQNI